MSSDLTLIQTDDLINELSKRFDHFVISAIKVTNKNGEFLQLRRHEGLRHVNIAQLEIFKNILIDMEISSSTLLPGNQDR